jgi:hypothetical protein
MRAMATAILTSNGTIAYYVRFKFDYFASYNSRRNQGYKKYLSLEGSQNPALLVFSFFLVPASCRRVLIFRFVTSGLLKHGLGYLLRVYILT